MSHTMEEAIVSFANQFAYVPQVENKSSLLQTNRFVLCGMGGSHLAADTVTMIAPGIDLKVHSDYGLPPIIADHSLIILSSYSGNTEEVVDSYHACLHFGLATLCISTGGHLIELAQKNSTPFIQLPNTGIQPRMALGYSLRALLFVVDSTLFELLGSLVESLNVRGMQSRGKELAIGLHERIPVIYSSNKNKPLAYNWKIKINETGKTPAFYNSVPEMNHNELESWAYADRDKFTIVMLFDTCDHPRITKRMEVAKSQLEGTGYEVIQLYFNSTKVHSVIETVSLADWTAYYLAVHSDKDPESVPTIEKFKALML